MRLPFGPAPVVNANDSIRFQKTKEGRYFIQTAMCAPTIGADGLKGMLVNGTVAVAVSPGSMTSISGCDTIENFPMKPPSADHSFSMRPNIWRRCTGKALSFLTRNVAVNGSDGFNGALAVTDILGISV